MFRRHLLSLGTWGATAAGGGLCLDQAADAGTGGAATGADPAVIVDADPHAGADPAAATADDGDAARTAGAADGDDDDLDGDDGGADHLPEQTLRTRFRRTQRFLNKRRGLIDRLRDPETRQFISEQQLDEMRQHAGYFREIDEVIAADPDLANRLLQARTRRLSGQPAAAAEPAEQVFDEAAFRAEWGYEVETDAGQKFYRQHLALAKGLHEQTQRNNRLEQRLAGVDQRDQTRSHQQLETQWKQAAIAAAKDVDEPYRPMFVRAVRAEFQLLKAQGLLDRTTAEQVIARHLDPIRQRNKTTQRTQLNRQSATVAGNGQQPKTPRPGAMTPANGAAPNTKRETIADSRKSFYGRLTTS